MGDLDHHKMNTSAQEYRAPQQHMHHGEEGNTNPTQGQRPLLPWSKMKRGKQSTTTPQALRQGNRAVTWSNQIPRGRDQHRNWPGRRKGPTKGGRETTASGGGEPPTAQQRTTTRKPHHTAGGTHRPKRRQPQKRRQKHQQERTQHRGATAREEPKRTPKTNRGQGKHPKNGNSGVQEGDRTTKRRAKRPPPRDSKWEQVTKRCQGTDGTEDRAGVNKTRQVKGRGEKGGGIATSYSV